MNVRILIYILIVLVVIKIYVLIVIRRFIIKVKEKNIQKNYLLINKYIKIFKYLKIIINFILIKYFFS